MKSIIWLKVHQKNLLSYIILVSVFSIISSIVYLRMGIELINIVAIFPLISVFIAFIFSFDDSVFILSENVFSTPLKISDIWLGNATFIASTGLIIGEIMLIILCFVLKISFINAQQVIMIIVANLLCCLLGYSIVLMSTVHYATFSKPLQYLASIFSIGYFSFPFVFPNIIKSINLNWTIVISIGIVAVLLIILSDLLIGKFDKEKLIINTSEQFKTILSEIDRE